MQFCEVCKKRKGCVGVCPELERHLASEGIANELSTEGQKSYKAREEVLTKAKKYYRAGRMSGVNLDALRKNLKASGKVQTWGNMTQLQEWLTDKDDEAIKRF